MKNTYLIAVALFLITNSVTAQSDSEVKPKELKWKSTYELIFSWGDVDDEKSSVDGSKVDGDAVVRFSAFYNGGTQAHYNFTRHFGFYTGLGIRNIGFINDFGDSVTVKQREYSLGLPLALKLGNLEKNFFIAGGAEVEMFFAYKQKVFYNNQKDKYHEWFSGNEELFNFSLFGEINTPGGGFIRFRYYLNDFLLQNNKGIDLPNNGGKLAYDSSPSSLMYISIGTAQYLSKYYKKKEKKTNPLDNL